MTILTRRSSISAWFAAIMALIDATDAIAEQLCRPALTLDASACAEDSKGKFEIVFTRLSENAPDLEFRKQYIWSAPSSVWPVPFLGVGLAFAADEAAGHYRIDDVTPCACRN